MRFVIEYEMGGEYLPQDYRSGFISLIKNALQKSNLVLFEQYYGSHQLKPFTFSVYFPELTDSADKNLHVGKKVRFIFSTFSLELATYLYNGLIKTRSYNLFGNEMIFRSANLRRDTKIRSEETVFKTISPVLISNEGSSEWHLLPGEKGFIEGLNFAVGEIAQKFLAKEKATIEFDPLRIKKKILRHYGQHRSSFTGVFKLKGDIEVLQLIYDVGLGVRRNQGFGMLEVVR